MRGAKVVVRLFPHEVVDVEPVLDLIYQQDPNDFQVQSASSLIFFLLGVSLKKGLYWGLVE